MRKRIDDVLCWIDDVRYPALAVICLGALGSIWIGTAGSLAWLRSGSALGLGLALASLLVLRGYWLERPLAGALTAGSAIALGFALFIARLNPPGIAWRYVAGLLLLPGIATLAWRGLGDFWDTSGYEEVAGPSDVGPAPARRYSLNLPAWLWIPAFSASAIALFPAHLRLDSGFLMECYAVCAILLAASGRQRRGPALAAATLAGLVALDVGYRYVALASGSHGMGITWIPVVGAGLVLGLSLVQVDRLRRRVAAINPVALVAGQLVIAVGSRWLYYGLSGVGIDPASYGSTATSSVAVVVRSVLRPDLVLLGAALAGIGLGLTRSWRPAAVRLGLRMPTAASVLTGLLVADAASLTMAGASYLTFRLMPHATAQINQTVANQFRLGVLIVLVSGIGAAIAEETLFRGAVLPRLGIVGAAALFAAAHIQYGLTPIVLMIFLHGILYGLLRRYLDLNAAIVAHASYDIVFAGLGLVTVPILIVGVPILLYRNRVTPRRLADAISAAVADEKQVLSGVSVPLIRAFRALDPARDEPPDEIDQRRIQEIAAPNPP